MINGRIVRIESKDYYILDKDDKIIRCNLRGKFKKTFNLKRDKLYKVDIAAVGDFVNISMNDDGTGTIVEIEERKNYLSRKAPKIKGSSFRGERLEQVIAVNLDSIVIVSSIDEPRFNSRVIDRILVAGESSNISVTIVINKLDLDYEDFIVPWKELYEDIGYKVILTSVNNEIGLETLKKELSGKVSLLWGQSGVGKSSILNSIYPELNLRVGEISDYSNKGQHTTVTSIMTKVDENTFVVDTPGIREIAPFGIMKIDLPHYFIEFNNFIESCKFNTCTHFHEPGCGVVDAIEREKISIERYESYLNMLDTIEEDINF